MEILKGGGGLLIELGRDAILSEQLLPSSPPHDALYPHVGKKCDSRGAIGGTY